jgi:hypothetical protein
MTREELQQLIAHVQKHQIEMANVEVKAARGGTPRRLYEPLSAFSNCTGGGVLVFELDEASDFSIVGVGDAHRLQEEITHLASTEMEPTLRHVWKVPPGVSAADHDYVHAVERYHRRGEDTAGRPAAIAVLVPSIPNLSLNYLG